MDQAKQLATDANETNSKRLIQKTTEATSDLIGNKSAAKIANVSKISPQNTSETVPNEIYIYIYIYIYICIYIYIFSTSFLAQS